MTSEFTPPNPDYEEQVQRLFESMPFMAFLGIELYSYAPGKVELRVPYQKGVTQQHGYFNGGLAATLADNASGCASYSLAPEGYDTMTVEFKINFVRPARGDVLIARAQVIKPGRMLAVIESKVYVQRDGEEILCAACQGTWAYLDRSR